MHRIILDIITPVQGFIMTLFLGVEAHVHDARVCSVFQQGCGTRQRPLPQLVCNLATQQQ